MYRSCYRGISQLSIVSISTLLFITGATTDARAIVTVDNPDRHLVAPNEFTGVVSLQIPNPFTGLYEHGCTGSLLTGGQHILTAAHCVTGAFRLGLTVEDVGVAFSLPDETVSRTISKAFVFPAYSDDNIYRRDGDLAILKLAEKAPSGAQEYEIYRNNDEVGQISTVVGYGWYGTGSTGHIPNTSGQKKIFGQNKIEGLVGLINNLIDNQAIPESQLIVDFDNGNPTHDTFGALYGINDLGLGINEVVPAPGDSGSPWFIDNKIAGIVSWGFGFPGVPNPPDIDRLGSDSFGEIGVSTRVSIYSRFIDRSTTTPEPHLPLALLSFGMLTISTSRIQKIKK